MTKTLSEIFGWVRGKAFSYILIVIILLGGTWAQREISKIAAHEAEAKSIETTIHRIDEELQKLRSGSDPVNKAYARAALFQQSKENERNSFAEDNRVLTKIPFTSDWRQLEELDMEVKLASAATATAGRLVNERHRALTKARQAQVETKSRLDEILKTARAWREILPTLWLAAWILVSAVATGIAIKVFLYFVVAPLASRRPPIQIMPNANGAVRSGFVPEMATTSGKVSAVSSSLSLDENVELLIRPEYLQSTSERARKTTKWLLNSAIPYGSILSGMFLLTRVTSPQPDEVVVSSTKDPLSEVCFIDLLSDSAFVCQPRALVGVVQDPDNPVRITRHWRLGSLQSWLTLQLRFLVFHGPGKLIIKGCRGVRIESAERSRIINQAATLGFSANLRYSNTRCETFLPYWMGKKDLFNDIFSGDRGFYVYEEMPDYKHKSGLAGRGLEGLLDSVLKVFGI